MVTFPAGPLPQASCRPSCRPLWPPLGPRGTARQLGQRQKAPREASETQESALTPHPSRTCPARHQEKEGAARGSPQQRVATHAYLRPHLGANQVHSCRTQRCPSRTTHLEMDSSRTRAFCSSSRICLRMSPSPSEAEDGVPSNSQRSRSALDWGVRDGGQSPWGWGQGQGQLGLPSRRALPVGHPVRRPCPPTTFRCCSSLRSSSSWRRLLSISACLLRFSCGQWQVRTRPQARGVTRPSPLGHVGPASLRGHR